MDPAPPEVALEDAPGRCQEEEEGEADEERWSRLLPELLTGIVHRVDAGAERSPPRRDVVLAFPYPPAAKIWLICTLLGLLFAHSCICGYARCNRGNDLQQPGPRDAPMHLHQEEQKHLHLLSLTQLNTG
ncbi:hypothetical protein D1007_25499 [Hordeum vulgare]|nr:hypothetical protein D1007_25499 [Hordeum vulgare]